MDTALVYLVAALVGGLAARAVRLPPLVGFLLAGFVMGAAGVPKLPGLDTVADLGVTLMLFTVGLKLDIRTLLRRHVSVTATVHMAGFTLLAWAVLLLLSALGLTFAQPGATALLYVAFALSFSSTVFVVQHLEELDDDGSLYGRAAVGILLIQDIAAVAFLVAFSGSRPTVWALALVLVWPVTVLARRTWRRVGGGGDLQILFGTVMALVPGYWAFHSVGLKGDLGALVVGMLLAGDEHAPRLARSLLNIKDVMLVGFFLSIGLGGVPTLAEDLVALALLLLLPAKSALFVVLLRWAHLRNRTSALAAISLGNYSEFGLIVTAVGVEAGVIDERWLLTLSVAVALSFVVGAVAGRRELGLAAWLERRFRRRPNDELLPEDRYIDIGDANAVVMGLGRIGRSAFERLSRDPRLVVVGIESDPTRVARCRALGMRVVEGDATDEELWSRVRGHTELDLAVFALPHHDANMAALTLLGGDRFEGVTSVVTRVPEDDADALARGANAVMPLYAGAGTQLADEALVRWASLQRP